MANPAIAEWMSRAQAARRLDVTPQWVIRLARRGELDHIKTARGRLLDPPDVERLAEERRRRRGGGGALASEGGAK